MRISLLLLVLSGCTPSWGPTASCPDKSGSECGDGNNGGNNPGGDDSGTTDNSACNETLVVLEQACVAVGGSWAGTCVDGVAVSACAMASGDTIYNDNSVHDSYNQTNSGGESGEEVTYECNDGEDNDGDGDTDYPDDTDCSSPYDDSEEGSGGDTGGEFIDVLGYYYCSAPWSSDFATYFATYGTPSQVVLQDNDGDGVTDEVWVSGPVDWNEIHYLDLNADSSVDSTWTCHTAADGEDDNIDQDGDGIAAIDGDLDEISAGNHPVDATEEELQEVCGDAFDNDIDGSVDESCETDGDSDGEIDFYQDCNDDAPAIYVGAYEYDNVTDDDCDGTIDEDNEVIDLDADGYTEAAGDCNDADAGTNPAAFDWDDDSVDQDCNGVTDDGDYDLDGCPGYADSDDYDATVC